MDLFGLGKSGLTDIGTNEDGRGFRGEGEWGMYFFGSLLESKQTVIVQENDAITVIW